MLRLEARWFIDVYRSGEDMNPILLELAELDFNMVQAAHQEDLKEVSRKMLTKINALITTIDDVYDVYGTLDELELFTDAVERFILIAMGHQCNGSAPRLYEDIYVSLLSTIQLMKWHLTPIRNKDSTSFGPVILGHAYFFVTNPVTKEALDCLEEYPNIIRWSSMILRLADDLGTSEDELERGDVPKSIQCYMNENSATEEDAREYIRSLISTTWKKMNEEAGAASSTFSRTFIEIAMNLGRTAQCMYQYGDGHGVVDRETKKRILSLFIHPVPLETQP
ncbi:hypothetical protein FH972_027205 [Carpinus fangiana]|uniref:Terpene synthase metal-binding domain-containing protein n=1 Tax=Carpinus fangiana TaxID=176857 RepID=A0A5N6L6L5_9ROSI|nr:hypothetical protein FH972_027205 [Carpinus fangiana]